MLYYIHHRPNSNHPNPADSLLRTGQSLEYFLTIGFDLQLCPVAICYPRLALMYASSCISLSPLPIMSSLVH